ncbi:hypothetical protein PYCC9005_002198 [Savitreella phatthalungensis]
MKLSDEDSMIAGFVALSICLTLLVLSLKGRRLAESDTFDGTRDISLDDDEEKLAGPYYNNSPPKRSFVRRVCAAIFGTRSPRRPLTPTFTITFADDILTHGPDPRNACDEKFQTAGIQHDGKVAVDEVDLACLSSADLLDGRDSLNLDSPSSRPKSKPTTMNLHVSEGGHGYCTPLVPASS